MFLRSEHGEDSTNSLWVVREGEPSVRLFDASLQDSSELTEAEQARRERAREQAGGVVSFFAQTDHQSVVFVLAGNITRVSAAGNAGDLMSSGNAFDPRPEPGTERVAYVDGATMRLTDGTADRSIPGTDAGEGTVTWGSAEFVAAEEMGRGRGYWWAPDGKQMAVCRVDTSNVDEWWISSPERPEAAPRAIRYPGAGTTNATVELWVVDVDDGPVRQLDWAGAEFEYLADVQWLAIAGRQVVRCTVQPRDQKTVVIIDFDPETGEKAEVQRIVDEHWVELHAATPLQSPIGVITVVDDGLRRVAVDGAPVVLSSPSNDLSNCNVRALVGTSNGRIIATVTTDGTDSIVASIDADGVTDFLTEPGLFSTAVVGGSTIVVTTARSDGDTTTEVRWGSGEVTAIESFAATPGFDCTPSFHVLTNRGVNAALCLPKNHDGSPLPVLLDPYGGPHAQRVLRVRNGYATSQWFAEQGFAVVVIDGRGTPGKGPAFEREIYGDFATKVLDDQIDALHELAKTEPALDLSRVGIRGWSFGGYLAALAVMRRPDAVHAAVAGAPVTDWTLYDTHYTERYIGHPDTDAANYERSSLLTDAPNLGRPLMLIHGLADDNVVAAHTLKLSQALLEAGRAHEVLPLSGVTHMTPQEQVAENLLHLQRDFLLRHLSLQISVDPAE